jgi:predicted transcriptional regulator
MALREEGMSNHDIAAKLDITEQTVRNYIGPQYERFSRLAAFADSEPKRTEECPPLEPAYSPKVVREDFEIADGISAAIYFDESEGTGIFLTSSSGTVRLSPDQAATVMQFLAWASKHIERR